jgi:hypothetical protein
MRPPTPDPLPDLIDRGPASVDLAARARHAIVRELTTALVKELRAEDAAAAAEQAQASATAAPTPARRKRPLRAAS